MVFNSGRAMLVDIHLREDYLRDMETYIRGFKNLDSHTPSKFTIEIIRKIEAESFYFNRAETKKLILIILMILMYIKSLKPAGKKTCNVRLAKLLNLNTRILVYIFMHYLIN